MFGTGLLKGLGVTLKHFTDTFTDDRRKEPSRYEGSIKLDDGRRIIDQPITQEGLLTIQYPEERRLLPGHRNRRGSVHCVRHLRQGLPATVHLDRARQRRKWQADH
jgi:hypothetical protein